MNPVGIKELTQTHQGQAISWLHITPGLTQNAVDFSETRVRASHKNDRCPHVKQLQTLAHKLD